MATGSKKFTWRSFTTFSIVMVFVTIAVTGIVLYIAPPGRVSNWSGWTLFGLTKTQWQSIHTIFSFLFVIGAAFHLYFNWKVLIGYLRKKLEQTMKYKMELASSSAVILAVFIMTALDAYPISLVMEWGDDLKNGWVTQNEEPPVPHAELLSLVEFAAESKIQIEQIHQKLSASGITNVQDSLTIAFIAEQNGLTPMSLFEKMKVSQTGTASAVGEGGGYGRKTVLQICEQYNVSPEAGLQRLKERSIIVNYESNLRDISTKQGITPIEVVKIITNGIQ